MGTASTPVPEPLPARMRAVVRSRYGPPEVLAVQEVAVPTPDPEGVLVEIRAAALNPFDWHQMTGAPWLLRGEAGLLRPKSSRLGGDLAGRVVAIGEAVTGFAPGDEVVGVCEGALAEYTVAPPDRIVAKPAKVSFPDAAGLGIAGLTALQGLRRHGQLRAGQRLLVNGASGGVGTAAIQLGKWLGAEVTGVCSTRNVELVRSLGADHVVDYTNEDFTDTDTRYHVLLDNQGNRPIGACHRLLEEGGTYVIVGGAKTNPLFGPMGRMLGSVIRFSVGSRNAKPFIADVDASDLAQLAELMETGALRSVIDSVHPLDHIQKAMMRLGEGHARGKILIDPTLAE